MNSEYILSKYKEIGLIAETGKNKIYIAKDNVSGKLLVKKQLPLDANIEIYKKLIGKDTKDLPKIHYVVSDGKNNYVFEDYVPGTNLMEKLENEKSFSHKQVIEWSLMLCDILSVLHENDPPIIHRDIKPSNIIISNDGILKLIDFDIAREYKTDSGTDTAYIGTKKYASPEQYGFSQTDCRSDIFSLGITMAELLTGKTPDFNQVFDSYGVLEPVIKKCIAIDPMQRFQNVGELKKALEKIEQPFYKRPVNIIGAIAASICVLVMIATLTMFNSPVDGAEISYYLYNYNGSNKVDFSYTLSEITNEREDKQEEENQTENQIIDNTQTQPRIPAAGSVFVNGRLQSIDTIGQHNATAVLENGLPDFREVWLHNIDTHNILINNPVIDEELQTILGDKYDFFMDNMALSFLDDRAIIVFPVYEIDGSRAFITNAHAITSRGTYSTQMAVTQNGNIYLTLRRDGHDYYFTNDASRIYYAPTEILNSLGHAHYSIVFGNSSGIDMQQGENIFVKGNNTIIINREGDELYFELVVVSPWIDDTTATFSGQTTLEGTHARYGVFGDLFRATFSFGGTYLYLHADTRRPFDSSPFEDFSGMYRMQN